MRILSATQKFFSDWWRIDDILCSQLLCYQNIVPISNQWRWHFKSLFTNASNRSLFQCLHPGKTTELHTLNALILDTSIHYVSVIDISYIATPSFPIISWFILLGKLVEVDITTPSRLQLILA